MYLSYFVYYIILALCLVPDNPNISPSLYTLNYISLENNYLRDNDIIQLSKLFRFMTSLSILDLSKNYITEEKAYKFFTRLTYLQNLTEFYIESIIL